MTYIESLTRKIYKAYTTEFLSDIKIEFEKYKHLYDDIKIERFNNKIDNLLL